MRLLNAGVSLQRLVNLTGCINDDSLGVGTTAIERSDVVLLQSGRHLLLPVSP
jgi:hypothetical protein